MTDFHIVIQHLTDAKKFLSGVQSHIILAIMQYPIGTRKKTKQLRGLNINCENMIRQIEKILE